MMFTLIRIPDVEIQLALLDWIVLVAYGLGMLFIGWFYSRKNKTKEDYLLGGRKMNPTAVGISLFAALISTLSYLTYPAEMIQHGPIIFAGALAFPLVYYVAGWWLIPRIMQMKVTSAYEILEQKLGLSVRMLATFMFLSLRLLWMATIVYVTVDVALLSVVQFDRAYVPFIGALLMVITIVYTSMGGLKAVVVTDVVQSFIFLGGALLSIVVVCYQLGSFTAIFPANWPTHWDSLRLGFDPQERTTLGNAMLVLFVWYICTTGSDQMAIQRYLSTKDVKTARKSFRVSLSTDIIAYILLALVGLAMLAFFTKNEGFLIAEKTLNEQADTLFPRFIMIGLPPGVSGLVIAGLLAAAMSSMSSGLNSVSSVIAEDIVKRFRKKTAPASDPLKQVKKLSYLTGLIVMALSFFVGEVPGNLLDVIMKVVNLFVAPLFVLFFMALFVPFATGRATFWAGIIGVAVAIAVAFWGVFGITVLWIMPVSLVTGIVAGIVLSYADRLLLKPEPERS
ncbi:sodium:solute symporter family transporter [Agriterribacter sp.]|uniref:sodium:solute symporter family transporter n=1 Tax=Agriterribacter sp. TaxID=2821509 RepID=UPI002CF16410|nr:sodium/solute symporter [Agriterribacter sp.]HTN06181.1 sodium/solute symporter [Agriterribacter sp.]